MLPAGGKGTRSSTSASRIDASRPTCFTVAGGTLERSSDPVARLRSASARACWASTSSLFNSPDVDS
jgi:hypothetical protein